MVVSANMRVSWGIVECLPLEIATQLRGTALRRAGDDGATEGDDALSTGLVDEGTHGLDRALMDDGALNRDLIALGRPRARTRQPLSQALAKVREDRL